MKIDDKLCRFLNYITLFLSSVCTGRVCVKKGLLISRELKGIAVVDFQCAIDVTNPSFLIFLWLYVLTSDDCKLCKRYRAMS